jgi:replicative DNA helicase
MPNLAVRAEQAVLGALLTDHTLLDQVPYLAGSDFSDVTHKWIFDAIAETRVAHSDAAGRVQSHSEDADAPRCVLYYGKGHRPGCRRAGRP